MPPTLQPLTFSNHSHRRSHVEGAGPAPVLQARGGPRRLAHLTRLEELDLGMCQKVSGDVGIAAHLPRLRAVSLTGRGVVETSSRSAPATTSSGSTSTTRGSGAA